jgi:hypothetical protein
MLDFFIDNIFVQFSGLVFQQTISIPMGTNCVPLLADLFLHANEADFLQWLLKNEDRKLPQTFYSSFHWKNKKLTALKSNSNTVWFNFQTYIYIYIVETGIKGLR